MQGRLSEDERGARLILTPDQRLRVFVSSTLRELSEERAAVREAISRLSLTPVMFELGARPHPPRALYRSYLDQSDVFVGIYAESYGWVAPDEDASGLEDEYRLSGRLPRLLYVREPAPSRERRLSELLERIQGDDLASYKPFTTPDELRQLVTDDLMVLLSEEFQAARHGAESRTPEDLILSPPAEPLTAIVGRDDEAQALLDLLANGARLVAITGAGGVGKSRLAIEVAHRVCATLGVDVHFVDLTPVAAADGVFPEVARTLGIPVEGQRGPVASLTDYLRERRLLLLLDNFEHVAGAAVELPELLSSCKDLQVLVTSRQVLRLRGETEFPLAPLQVPPIASTADDVRHNPTVRLFVERAQAAQPSFALTNDNLAPVAEIARRLDGIPLAIELAAARVRLLPANVLLDRLETRLDLLSSGAADLPERQRTLWAAIDWSYNLLSPEEQEVFAQLAVFVDGWTLDAAESVCVTETGNTLDILLALLEKSLFVLVTPTQADEPRMRMLEPVRQYADQKLNASGERAAVRARHANYFGLLVFEHQSRLQGAEQQTWSDELASEEGNLRAAVRWWQEAGDAEALGHFIWATYIHYWLSGRLLQEFATWVESANDLAALMTPASRARLGIVNAFRILGLANLDEAAAAIEETLSLLDGLGLESEVLYGRIIQATILSLQGDPSASQAIEEVLASPALTDPWLRAMAYWTAGGTALIAGDLERAETCHAEAVLLGRGFGSWQVIGQGLGRLAFVYLAQGRPQEALGALRESVDCFRRIRYREGLSYDLFALASLLALYGDEVGATQALAASHATQELIGVPMWEVFFSLFEGLRSQLQGSLGERFDPLWADGSAVDIYAAADRALAAATRTRQQEDSGQR